MSNITMKLTRIAALEEDKRVYASGCEGVVDFYEYILCMIEKFCKKDGVILNDVVKNFINDVLEKYQESVEKSKIARQTTIDLITNYAELENLRIKQHKNLWHQKKLLIMGYCFVVTEMLI